MTLTVRDITAADETRWRADFPSFGTSVDQVVRGLKDAPRGVERVTLGARRLYGFDGGPLFVTAEHPFMTDTGWKSINPSATAAENDSLKVGALAPGDALVTIGRSDWRLAALGNPRSTVTTSVCGGNSSRRWYG